MSHAYSHHAVTQTFLKWVHSLKGHRCFSRHAQSLEAPHFRPSSGRYPKAHGTGPLNQVKEVNMPTIAE